MKRDAMGMLAEVAQREGWRAGYRAGRDAALRSLGPAGRRALVDVVERERAEWEPVMRWLERYRD